MLSCQKRTGMQDIRPYYLHCALFDDFVPFSLCELRKTELLKLAESTCSACAVASQSAQPVGLMRAMRGRSRS